MDSIGADLSVMPRTPLADAHVDAIREIATVKTYETGDILAAIGDPMDHFVYVVDGEVEVVDPYTGERMLDATLGPTQFMGELAFLNGGTWTLAMRAAAPTQTLEVPRTRMLDLMSKVPEMSDHIITVYAARRRIGVEQGRSSVKIIGADRDAKIRDVASFLSRNRIPFQSYDMDNTDTETAQVCSVVGHKPSVVFDANHVVDDPTPGKIAKLLGLDLDIGDAELFDLLIVGGGPAGVAAAVYAGSEGLKALVVEDVAIGGQAGTSSRIENYMGFPTGISGADLIYRGQIQAMKFGTRFAMPRRVERLQRRDDGSYCATLDGATGEGGDTICTRAILVATGVQYRRLPLDRLEEFEGNGIFYAATEMEARMCAKKQALIIGGGNSAGQAAMFLSRSADHVHILIRGDSLADSMSSYLEERLIADPGITIHYGTTVEALHGEDWLERATVKGPDGSRDMDCGALFIMVGAAPNTGWLSGLVDLDDNGFVETGHGGGRQGVAFRHFRARHFRGRRYARRIGETRGFRCGRRVCGGVHHLAICPRSDGRAGRRLNIAAIATIAATCARVPPRGVRGVLDEIAVPVACAIGPPYGPAFAQATFADCTAARAAFIAAASPDRLASRTARRASIRLSTCIWRSHGVNAGLLARHRRSLTTMYRPSGVWTGPAGSRFPEEPVRRVPRAYAPPRPQHRHPPDRPEPDLRGLECARHAPGSTRTIWAAGRVHRPAPDFRSPRRRISGPIVAEKSSRAADRTPSASNGIPPCADRPRMAGVP